MIIPELNNGKPVERNEVYSSWWSRHKDKKKGLKTPKYYYYDLESREIERNQCRDLRLGFPFIYVSPKSSKLGIEYTDGSIESLQEEYEVICRAGRSTMPGRAY